MRKYRNKKTIVDGIVFDSRKEANRYKELVLLQKVGEISHLELQKEYELVPAQYANVPQYGKNGNRIKDKRVCLEKAVKYKADFVYEENGKTIVEDTKGMKTKDYIIKRKLMLYQHGIRIKEV
jgi:hypothetical protein